MCMDVCATHVFTWPFSQAFSFCEICSNWVLIAQEVIKHFLSSLSASLSLCLTAYGNDGKIVDYITQASRLGGKIEWKLLARFVFAPRFVAFFSTTFFSYFAQIVLSVLWQTGKNLLQPICRCNQRGKGEEEGEGRRANHSAQIWSDFHFSWESNMEQQQQQQQREKE